MYGSSLILYRLRVVFFAPTLMYCVVYRKSLDGVAVATDQSISGASVTQEAEITTLVFTRPLAPIGKVELSATEGDVSSTSCRFCCFRWWWWWWWG